MDSDPTNSAIFNEIWELMVNEVSATCTALLVYGLYTNLFIFAIYTLSRRKTVGRTPLLVACWAMFIVGTTAIVLGIVGTAISARIVQQVVQQHENSELMRISNSLLAAEDIMFVMNNLESGAIYCICLIVVVLALSLDQIPITFKGVAYGLARQMVVSGPYRFSRLLDLIISFLAPEHSPDIDDSTRWYGA
ncbi:hypothetical protein C8R44DRAFT_894299 [Mycena epipterygia]|nr:hypothetical protein C8R44DRAFT_894299 [Mycena epipterygia]